MEQRPEDHFVEIRETLVGRKPGGSAAEKAGELRRADPLGVVRSLLLRERTEERAWRKGAHGERFVGFVLARLPNAWSVFNDIPIGERGANIDHVVIGPGGTFTINAKNLTGKVWVGSRLIRHNGYPTNYLPKAASEASRASRLLTASVGSPVEVKGVLAILADDWTIKEKPTDVHVGSPRGVKDWLRRLPVVLSPREIIEIAAAASKPSTWSLRVGTSCPCGGVMVERRRRSDGETFLGCSRYPQCRRTHR